MMHEERECCPNGGQTKARSNFVQGKSQRNARKAKAFARSGKKKI
jgi:hypothetical protein